LGKGIGHLFRKVSNPRSPKKEAYGVGQKGFNWGWERGGINGRFWGRKFNFLNSFKKGRGVEVS